MPKIKTGCPKDCLDVCSLIAHLEKGRIVKVTGDPEHPYTKGWLCAKGNSYPERIYSPERILYPLKRNRCTNKWSRISWESAYEEISSTLKQIKAAYGTTAVFHNYDGGSGGVLKNLDRRFFNAYGGVTEPEGSLCWGAGRQAQKYDFGGYGCHSPLDLENAHCIVVWGRDLARTNQHLIPFVNKALTKGAKLIVINPRETELGKKADLLLQPKPGSDGALALATANYLIKNRLINQEFVQNHTFGSESFIKSLENCSLEWAEQITGLDAGLISKFAKMYGSIKPASILIGYGLQRYANGGMNVRAIDALAALTGNLGIEGGGANYAGKNPWGLEDRIIGEELAANRRYLLRANLGEELLKAKEPPIKAVFVTRSNPLCQSPDSTKLIEAFTKIPFVVVVEEFMTDTARYADLVLPCSSIFEQDELITSSWVNWLTVARQVITPVGQSKPDQQIFSELAEKMNLPGFGPSLKEWFIYVCDPLLKMGLGSKVLLGGGIIHPDLDQVPWRDKTFPTPTGKYEFYSLQAEKDGYPPLPVFQPTEEAPSREYPLYFLSPHSQYRINSQFGTEESIRRLNSEPFAELNPQTASKYGIEEGKRIKISSRQGEIEALTVFKPQMAENVVMVESGWWQKTGGSPNLLTKGKLSDLGKGTAFYECTCRIEPIN